ncbi:MAG: magnesium transporter [Candidatus Aminicenantales bacterium]
MINYLLAPELRELIKEKKYEDLANFCATVHPGLAAEFISALELTEIWEVLSHLPASIRGEIFSHLDEDVQVAMVDTLKRDDLGRLLSDMPPDDRVDLLKHIPEKKREAIIPAMAQAEREDLRRLIAYPEGSAGSVMTSDYAVLTPDLTVDEAVAKLRREAPDKETIYYSYVIDNQQRLIGFVSLKDLILARPEARVGDIMHRDVIAVRAADDQEDVARKIQKYDLLAVPVVDDQERLVGIITHDDAIDIITQEQQEDVEKLMAISGSHEVGAYMRLSVWDHFKSRMPWIVALAILGFVSGYIVQSFEALLVQVAILASFMPMLADTGGNAGSQSATLVIRALALKEISPRDGLRVLIKEFKVAFLMAILLAAISYLRVLLFIGQGSNSPVAPLKVGMAVAVALAFQVISSTIIGAFLPLIAAAAKVDPAVVASPALTTIVDITGLLIFFFTAKLIIGI